MPKATITPEEFVAGWTAPPPPGLSAYHLGVWTSPLVAAPAGPLESVDIPDAHKEFLVRAGLPHTCEWINACFDTLANGMPIIPEARPDAVDNDIEFPRRRYDLYYLLGREEATNSGSIAVLRKSGFIFRLDYGSGTFQKKVYHPGGGGTITRSETPVLDGYNLIGPSFVASSVPQLAHLYLTYRDLAVTYGVLGGETGGRLARRLNSALRKIDEAAVTHPEGNWGPILQYIRDGLW
jgi:hypothetical protein